MHFQKRRVVVVWEWTPISFAFRGMIFVRMLKSLCGMIPMRLLEQSVAGFTVESTFSAPNAPKTGQFQEVHVTEKRAWDQFLNPFLDPFS